MCLTGWITTEDTETDPNLCTLGEFWTDEDIDRLFSLAKVARAEIVAYPNMLEWEDIRGRRLRLRRVWNDR